MTRPIVVSLGVRQDIPRLPLEHSHGRTVSNSIFSIFRPNTISLVKEQRIRNSIEFASSLEVLRGGWRSLSLVRFKTSSANRAFHVVELALWEFLRFPFDRKGRSTCCRFYVTDVFASCHGALPPCAFVSSETSPLAFFSALSALPSFGGKT